MNRHSPKRRMITRLPRWGRVALVGVALVLLLGLALLGLSPLQTPFNASPSSSPSANGGFAGLGRAAEGFKAARPGEPLTFPTDHGAHPAYRTEWWYLTANLRDEENRPLGLQWTLFRQALVPPGASEDTREAENAATTSTHRGEKTDENTGESKRSSVTNPWTSNQLWMAHTAVSQGEQHVVAERLSRGSPPGLEGPAGVRAKPFAAWIDDWQMISTAPGTRSSTLSSTLPSTISSTLPSTLSSPADALSQLSVTATLDENTHYQLTLTAEGPLVAHGEAGFSQKAADGQGSYYYSQPFYRVDGEVTLNGATHRVSGQAWLDREWSSQLLGKTQQGWDWLSLHLADGSKLMAFRLRGGASAQGRDYLSGSFIDVDGDLTPLGPDELSLTPLSESSVAGRRLPTRWRLEVPGRGLDLTITARHPKRWMTTRVPYWEGAVTVSDTEGQPRGEGYLEMTGY